MRINEVDFASKSAGNIDWNLSRIKWIMLMHFIYLIVFTFLVWNGENAYILAADAELEVDEHLNQTHSRHHKLHKNVMAHGVVGLVPKISIHGAIIVSARGTMAPPVTEQDKRKHDMLLVFIHGREC